MEDQNASHYKKETLKNKKTSPVGMITMGVGIIFIGLAALLILAKADSAASIQEEYSSVPMEVKFDAPELALRNLAGKPETLKDYRGQVVMINLWATWCPPCKEELPVLAAYYEDHVDEGFVIIGIEDGQPAEEVEAYIKTTDVKYPIWIDREYLTEDAFSVFNLPSSFVIDREGTVRLAWTGVISTAMLEKYVTPIIEE